MARCSYCHEEIPEDDHFCPHCGAVQPRRPAPREQPPLPFSPWVPPRMAAEPAGGASAARSEPYIGPPLTVKQVTIAVSAILLFLLLVVVAGHGGMQSLLLGRSHSSSTAKPLPLLGKMNEAILVGKTAWGVAFTDQVQTVDHRPSARGKFYSVGVVIGNKSDTSYYLTVASVGLLDEATGERFKPKATAWGTPSAIIAQRYTNQYSLPPGTAIAGLIVFDVPVTTARPRLLVRDLSQPSLEFTGQIDLTQTKKEEARSVVRSDERDHPFHAW